MHERTIGFLHLLRLNKPVGGLLAMWPVIIAYFLALDGPIQYSYLFILASGAWIGRMAGCVVNDYLDRDIDRQVERTQNRPLATRLLSTKDAAITAGILAFLGVGLLLFLPTTAVVVALLVIPLCILYPLAKRITNFPQLALSIVFTWGIWVAWAAARPDSAPFDAWVIFVAGALWTIYFDTCYALPDAKHDVKLSLGSVAVLAGENFLAVACGLALISFLAWLLVGYWYAFLATGYYVALLVTFFLYLGQLYLLKTRGTSAGTTVFNINALVGAVLTLGVVVDRSM